MWPRRTGLLGPRTAAMLKAEPGAAHQSGSALPSFSSLWTINAPLHTHTHTHTHTEDELAPSALGHPLNGIYLQTGLNSPTSCCSFTGPTDTFAKNVKASDEPR